MQLPDSVKRRIEDRADSVGFPALKRAASVISDAYRDRRPLRLNDPERAAAYLVTRMPATYAAALTVLAEVRERIGAVASILDVGAGTGAASLAARSHFPEASLTLLERDAILYEAAREWLPTATILHTDLSRNEPLPPHDLVIAAYSLGESGADIARLWKAARRALVLIEPGTPDGFSFVRSVRDRLLAEGARMVAPCPAESPCPLVAPDWCHFAARVERSSLHRRIKDAGLGYEDEKYSYIALAREPVEIAPSRVIRRPIHKPGLILIQTCTPNGVETQRVLKRDRDRFHWARRAAWGDPGIS